MPLMSRALARLDVLDVCQDMSRYVLEALGYHLEVTYLERRDGLRCGFEIGMGL